MKPPARQHTSRARRAVETYEPPSSLGNDSDSGASDSTCRGPSQGVPPGVADDFSDVLEVLSLRARWGVSSRSCPRLLRGRGVPPGPNSPTSSLRSWACSGIEESRQRQRRRRSGQEPPKDVLPRVVNLSVAGTPAS
jgi:hypothetical protein